MRSQAQPRILSINLRWAFGVNRRAATIALTLALISALVLTAHAQTFRVIHTFTGAQDGGNPYSGLTRDRAGHLYGTTFSYGSHGYGMVYQMKQSGSSWIFNPLYGFTGGSNGQNPRAEVTIGPDGLVYGTTLYGGNGGGTVFKLRPTPTACTTAICGWSQSVIYTFLNDPDGAYAEGGVTFDAAGNIFGATYNGGMGHCGNGGASCGAVYKLTSSNGSWTESVLYRFSGSDGALPWVGVILDDAGNIYGTTSIGGLTNAGTVFELSYVAGFGWTESFLNSFRDGNDGGYPYAELIFDQSGNLFGSSSDGGAEGGGTIFELMPCGAGCWTYSLLYSFTGTPGGQLHSCGPSASLGIDGAGNLYGTTKCDGAHNLGSVFTLINGGNGNWTYRDLYDFTGGNDGEYPYSNVVFDGSGNLYGTAYAGGSQGVGVVWQITP